MKQAFKDLINTLKNMNRLSKYCFKYGNPIVFTSAVLAVFLRASAGTLGIFDNMIYFSRELLVLTRDMISVVYVPALLIEIVVLAEKGDNRRIY